MRVLNKSRTQRSHNRLFPNL